MQASAGENASVEPRARELAKGSIHSPTRSVRQEHSSPPSLNPPSLDESLTTIRYTTHAHDIMVMSAV